MKTIIIVSLGASVENHLRLQDYMRGMRAQTNGDLRSAILTFCSTKADYNNYVSLKALSLCEKKATEQDSVL